LARHIIGWYWWSADDFLGFEAWWPQNKLAVRGYVEVLRHYREITSIQPTPLPSSFEDASRVCSWAWMRQISIWICHSNSGVKVSLRFNLYVRRFGLGVQSVFTTIRKSVDHVLCLFPFEKALLENHGIAATYVGHPLARSIPCIT
jgi:lipid-A-disaccharide synthase